MHKAKPKGFTLIELMIVVVIVGILMAVALPSYREYVLRSHRVDGKIALTQCASRQERWFTKSNRYNSNADACPATSPEGYYSIDVAPGDLAANDGTCDTATNVNNDCFLITALPTSVAGQNNDITCSSMSIDSMNRKRAVDVNNADTKAECWNR
jgi:type IV pilus assembly protein PilE